MITLTLNPRVREIIETAIRAAKPFWFGFTAGGLEVYPRKALWMIATGTNSFENGNTVQWEVDMTRLFDGAIFATTPNAHPLYTCALTYSAKVYHHDRITLAIGGLTIFGPLPSGE